jgi:hypothetical protein
MIVSSRVQQASRTNSCLDKTERTNHCARRSESFIAAARVISIIERIVENTITRVLVSICVTTPTNMGMRSDKRGVDLA